MKKNAFLPGNRVKFTADISRCLGHDAQKLRGTVETVTDYGGNVPPIIGVRWDTIGGIQKVISSNLRRA